MRKSLSAGVAALAIATWAGAAGAQPHDMPAMSMQGMRAASPASSPPAGANNNNNSGPSATPGAVTNPTPGSVVIHFNGRVTTEFNAGWSNLDSGSFPAITGIGGATLAPAGNYKVQPTNITNYVRLYTGLDGMAANGLRYGGAIEIRENFTGQAASASSTGASGYSSSETLYVRRAFAYVASDRIGMLRAGQGDGLIGLYDNGVTTFQFLPSGNLGGGDLQTVNGTTSVTFAFQSLQGNEYGNSKLVYLSPQFYGFDFGFQWAPSTNNGFGSGAPTTFGTVAGCPTASSGCPGLSSSTVAADGARILNQTAAGARYQQKFGAVSVLAYGVYEFGGHANYTGPIVTTPTNGGGTGRFDDLSFGNAGIAVTYAGMTVGGNWVGGAVNGAGALRPSGGAGTQGWLIGTIYKSGPLVIGAVGESIDSQGSPALVGKTQRHEYAIDGGASYIVAPGLVGWVEYVYQFRKQNGFNFASNSPGGAFNTVQSQVLELGTTIYW